VNSPIDSERENGVVDNLFMRALYSTTEMNHEYKHGKYTELQDVSNSAKTHDRKSIKQNGVAYVAQNDTSRLLF
jgi:hypothetical protein